MARTYEEILKEYTASKDSIETMSVDDIVSEGVTHYSGNPLLGFLASILSPKDLLKAPGKLAKVVGTPSKKITPEVIEKLNKIDRSRPFEETQTLNAIRDSAKLAKALKVSDKLKGAPSLEAIDDLIVSATKLPIDASARSKLAVKDLLSTYLLPARRRAEYNTLTPDEIIKNLQTRGILTESGAPAEDVVRVIRGQRSPYERLRTPVENFQEVLKPHDISNHAVFASKSAREAANYSGYELANVGKGRVPVSYPMYAKLDDTIFNSLNPEHVDKVAAKLYSPVYTRTPVKNLELIDNLTNLRNRGSQDWQVLEQADIQQAMKEAGFRGFMTDEAGVNSNVGMFDPAEFLSIFSSGAPGVSDIK